MGADPADERGGNAGEGSDDQGGDQQGYDDQLDGMGEPLEDGTQPGVYGTKAFAISSNKPLTSKYRGGALRTESGVTRSHSSEATQSVHGRRARVP
jgi:hypothetical protein